MKNGHETHGRIGQVARCVRRRLEQVLRVQQRQWRDPALEVVRQLRALEVLQTAATPLAIQPLNRMAGGALGSRVTGDARASLGRLKRRATS